MNLKLTLLLISVMIFTNINAQMKVLSNGNVGVGTTSPQSKFDVNGTICGEPSTLDAGAYTNFVSGLGNYDYSNPSNCDRELRIQTVNNTGSYLQYLIYNGMITGDYNNPVYNQGAWGYFSGIAFQQDRTNFLVNTGTAGTGTPFTITPTKALTISNSGHIGIGSEYTGSYYLYVNGSAWSNGTWQSSDMRFKKNITPIDSALSKLLKLNGKTYELRKDDFKDFHFDDGKNLGFLAQEVKEVLPEAVRLDSNGYYSINYDMLIPILVEAIKQQNTQIETTQKTISELQQQLNTCCSIGATRNSGDNKTGVNEINNSTAGTSVILYQNAPNPYTVSTVIKCYLPQTINSAKLCVYNTQGELVKCFNISERGNTSVTIQGSELFSGIYAYVLITDGQASETKQMILTK
ncbi:MAG: tail fiber domain-containing protein [Bacteroidales bacterium]